ncbi:MAG: YggS family pyridoxal phosphate enzyme, partial [Oscillospiraceae bacterium]
MERLLCIEDSEKIRENYLRICENIEDAKAKANRSDDVRVMAVTKTVPVEKVNYAISLGINLLGENRVQEFMDKHEGYSQAEVHFIGGLQTNKVKYIVDKVSMIHSVDSVRLAEEIGKRALKAGRIMDILTEINIGEEQTKGGITAESAKDFCSQIAQIEGIRLRGLMT